MGIKYRVVHARNPWRKVGSHKSLFAAIDGNDGAKNLLLRIGRVGGKWQQYGDVSCVFVWEDGADTGFAFRLEPGPVGSVKAVQVPVSVLEVFETSAGATDDEILRCFSGADSKNGLQGTGSPYKQPPVQGISDSAESERQETLACYPDELPEGMRYLEGLAREVLVNAFERNPMARAACIAHFGPVCQVCHLKFDDKYGPIGEGFIHVHHCVPIASIGIEYEVNPIVDLVPVCPNCHAMLHMQEPPFTVNELRALLPDGES